MRFQPLEKLMNLRDGYSRQFKIDNLQLILTQRQGQIHIFEANCPHRSHPLGTAVIDAGILRCPLHGYEFSLANGSLVHATEERCRGLRLYTVIYQGNELGLMLED